MTDFNRDRYSVYTSEPVSTALHYPINYLRGYESRHIKDVNTPNYHEEIKKGRVIINPLWFETITHFLPDDTVSWKSVGWPEATADASGTANYLRSCVGYLPQSCDFIVGDGNLPGIPATVDQNDTIELVKQASLAFVDKPKYGFGEDLFEIRETIRFIRNPLKSIYGLITDFGKKSKQIRRALSRERSKAEIAKDLAELWASYSFALRPLIQSIDNAIQAFHDETDKALRKTSRSKESLSAHTEQFVDGYHTSGNYASCIITNTTTVDMHAGVLYEASQLSDLQYLLGLRNKDLAVTAWEVIPMSFMIDRVINIKRSLMALINLVDPTVDIKGAFLVKRERYSHSVLCTSIVAPPGTAITAFSPLSHDSEIFRMSRVEWEPGISFTMPLSNPKELIKDISSIADLVALIVLKAGPLLRSF